MHVSTFGNTRHSVVQRRLQPGSSDVAGEGISAVKGGSRQHLTCLPIVQVVDRPENWCFGSLTALNQRVLLYHAFPPHVLH
jgi:hypothetical protein